MKVRYRNVLGFNAIRLQYSAFYVLLVISRSRNIEKSKLITREPESNIGITAIYPIRWKVAGILIPMTSPETKTRDSKLWLIGASELQAKTMYIVWVWLGN